jgi:hypothetical protein
MMYSNVSARNEFYDGRPRRQQRVRAGAQGRDALGLQGIEMGAGRGEDSSARAAQVEGCGGHRRLQ